MGHGSHKPLILDYEEGLIIVKSNGASNHNLPKVKQDVM